MKEFETEIKFRYEGYRSDHETTWKKKVKARNGNSAIKKAEVDVRKYPGFEFIISRSANFNRV